MHGITNIEPPLIKPQHKDTWDKVINIHPVGSSFLYLDVPMTVAYYHIGNYNAVEKMVCHYVDGTGVIQSMEFTPSMFHVLLVEGVDEE